MDRSLLTRIGLGILGVVVLVGAFFVIRSTAPSAAPPEDSPSPVPWICSNAGPNYIKMRENRAKPFPMTIDPKKHYFADIVTSCGTMRVELDAKDAPIAVNNFVNLARSDFYVGQVFHRIDRSLGVIQAGDPGCPSDVAECGLGGPGYTIKDEWPTGLKPVLGAVAMASAGTPDSSGSQFEIIAGPSDEKLPRERTIFGQLQGQHSKDVAALILSIPTKINPAAVAAGVEAPEDFPSNEYVYIKKVRIIETNG